MEDKDLYMQLLDRPHPAEMFNNDPKHPRVWEKPPRFTNQDEAQEFLFESLIDTNSIDQLVDIIGRGVPLDAIAELVVMSGFAKGLWTPDLALLLMEPVIYILLFIAEQSGVDYNLSDKIPMDKEDSFKYEAALQSGMGAIGKIDLTGIKRHIPSDIRNEIEARFKKNDMADAVSQEQQQSPLPSLLGE